MTRKEITSFYQAHSRRLYNMSCRILLSPEDAEEVMHDTILKFVTMPFRPMEPQQVSAWLARTCIRASVDRLRKRKREALFLEEYADETATRPDAEPDAVIPAEASAARILAAMQRLPDPYRLVVTLVLAEGLDYQEIAAYTGLKETTLRSHFMRGKQKLIALLKEDGEPI
ncbi:MAG: RNA polymerase sigma factor [Bacteroidales bacterium]|nr:RNA polymerase sigma factor [Bacteroidales bacterium]